MTIATSERFDCSRGGSTQLVVTPLGNARLLRSTGVRRVEELDWWQSAATTALSMTLTPAHHFAARGLLDRNRALWGGFVVFAGTQRIYFAGDTAYAPFFVDVRYRLGPIDLALLPIGAYEPRWFMKAVHMNPAEAVQAHLDLQATATIGMHFGTFQMTTEGIDEPSHALNRAREALGVSNARFCYDRMGSRSSYAELTSVSFGSGRRFKASTSYLTRGGQVHAPLPMRSCLRVCSACDSMVPAATRCGKGAHMVPGVAAGQIVRDRLWSADLCGNVSCRAVRVTPTRGPSTCHDPFLRQVSPYEVGAFLILGSPRTVRWNRVCELRTSLNDTS